MILEFKAAPTILALILLAAPMRALAQDSAHAVVAPRTITPGTVAPGTIAPGTISGTVVDQSGAMVAAAKVTLTHEDQSPGQDTLSASDGEFSFASVAPGTFHL